MALVYRGYHVEFVDIVAMLEYNTEGEAVRSRKGRFLMIAPAINKPLETMDMTEEEREELKARLKRQILDTFSIGEIASLYLQAYYPEEYRKARMAPEDNTLQIKVVYGNNSGLPEKEG